MNPIALRADLLDFEADPGWSAADDAPGLRFRADHWLLIDAQGRIAGVQREAPDGAWQRHDHAGRLLMPGFIDTHVHMPQLEVIASYGTELLDWLNTYTFPAERRYADPAVCAAGAATFLEALLAHGTTAAVVFPTVHASSADALLGAARTRGMRLIAGQCLMDRHAPPDLTVAVDQSERDSEALIARWHGVDRLAYAVTVRFAPTSSDEQLALAGRLLARHRGNGSGLYLQTHVAESRAELAWVAELFPSARSYLDVYAQHGLLGPRSVLAHGIWLDEADRELLAREQAQVAHSPSSNLFLGSGLMPWRAHERAGVPISLASDVGGGTSLSMQRTMADAYKVQALQHERLPAWKALYTATRGAARALGLEHEIGSFDTGCTADAALWSWAHGAVAGVRDAAARTLHERAFAWMTLSDERNLMASLVAGQCLHGEI